MRRGLVEGADGVLPQHMQQVALSQDDDVIEALASDTPQDLRGVPSDRRRNRALRGKPDRCATKPWHPAGQRFYPRSPRPYSIARPSVANRGVCAGLLRRVFKREEGMTHRHVHDPLCVHVDDEESEDRAGTRRRRAARSHTPRPCDCLGMYSSSGRAAATVGARRACPSGWALRNTDAELEQFTADPSAPQSRFSDAMRRMSATRSGERRGSRARRRQDRQRHQSRNPMRCQRGSVSGLTSSNALYQPGGSLASITSKPRS